MPVVRVAIVSHSEKYTSLVYFSLCLIPNTMELIYLKEYSTILIRWNRFLSVGSESCSTHLFVVKQCLDIITGCRCMGRNRRRWWTMGGINSAQQIYRWNHQTNDWNHIPGAATNVDVQNPCRVIVTNASHQMFIWKNNSWRMLNGAGKRSTINDSHYYTVNSAQQIFIGT